MVVAKVKAALPSLCSIRTLVGSVGSSSTSWVLSRAFDRDDSAEVCRHGIS